MADVKVCPSGLSLYLTVVLATANGAVSPFLHRVRLVKKISDTIHAVGPIYHVDADLEIYWLAPESHIRSCSFHTLALYLCRFSLV